MSAEKYAEWIVNNQDKVGTPEFETVASAYREAKGTSMPAPQPKEATFEQKLQASTPMRIVQGLRDPIDAAAQLLPRAGQFVTSAGGLAPNAVSQWFGKEAQSVDTGIRENEQAYEAARKATGQEGVDVARLGGNVLSPANLAVATRLPAATTAIGRVGAGLVGGATGGALTPVTNQDTSFASQKTGQTALGGVAGGALGPVVGAAGDFIGKQLAKLKKVDESEIVKIAQQYASEVGENWNALGSQAKSNMIGLVQDAFKTYKGADPRAVLRARDFDIEGIPYLQGQVTRKPGEWAQEKNLSQLQGTGDPIRDRLAQQAQMLQQKIGGFASGAQEQQQGGNALVNALRDYDVKLSSDVSSKYKAAREAAGKDVEVPMQGIAQDFANVLDTFGDKVPSGVINNFRKYGIAEGGDMTQRKLFTVEEADKLLKVINANQSNDPATNAALSQLRNSVKGAVTKDAGVEDVFSPARKAAAERFSLQEAVPALERAANGTANPDTFVQDFIVSKGAQSSQVKEMARLLREGSPEAFNEARAQIGSYLQRKAFGENVTGDKGITPERYATALREFGSDKLSAFFDKAEIAQMKRLASIGANIESRPAGATPNTSGNWGAITGLTDRFLNPMIRAATSGATNEMNVRRALSRNINPELTPQDIKMIGALTGGLTYGAGASAGNQIK